MKPPAAVGLVQRSSKVVMPQEILGRELEGQCNRKCCSVSEASPHLVQVGDVVWFMLNLCLYCCKFGWCPHLNLANEICEYLGRLLKSGFISGGGASMMLFVGLLIR